MKFDIEVLKEKKWRVAIISSLSLVVFVGVFALGVEVGFHKARFVAGYGDNYYRNFVGEKRGSFASRMMSNKFSERGGDFVRSDFGSPMMGGNGAAGEILLVSSSSLVVIDIDGIEKNVSVSDKTFIRRFRDTIKLGDLAAGDAVVVIGRANESGSIDAKLIRVMPNPSSALNGSNFKNSTNVKGGVTSFDIIASTSTQVEKK